MYLDNHASTPCAPKIIELFQSISSNLSIGNPHSTEHRYGWDADKIITQAQTDIADFINALPEEIIFTSGATESNNLAIIGSSLSAHLKKSTRNKIVVSAIEHKCVLNAAQHAKDTLNLEIAELPVNHHGIIDLQILENLLDTETLIVSVMAVNNEIGTVQPLQKIGALCKKYGCIFHVDAAQGIYSNLDVVENHIDMLSLSGHKIYAPKGIGLLYINQDMQMQPTPIIHGGEQQYGMRAGTLSPALCACMAKAIKIISDCKNDEIANLQEMCAIFLATLKTNNVSFAINGSMEYRHPGNLNLQLHGIDAGVLITRLQPHLAISTGSACNAGVIKNSYVLNAIGLDSEAIESSVRIGFGRYNTKSEVVNSATMIADEMGVMLAS